jgi:hypothetical protein
MNMLAHLMDSTDASSLGFGRNPERSTRSSNDHHSKLCINVGWKSVRYETPKLVPAYRGPQLKLTKPSAQMEQQA